MKPDKYRQSSSMIGKGEVKDEYFFTKELIEFLYK